MQNKLYQLVRKHAFKINAYIQHYIPALNNVAITVKWHRYFNISNIYIFIIYTEFTYFTKAIKIHMTPIV